VDGKRPEGVPCVFKNKDGKVAFVIELDFRPSGTDPLKSKTYYLKRILTVKIPINKSQIPSNKQITNNNAKFFGW